MRTLWALLLGLGAVATARPLVAADLAHIDRRLAREPEYHSKAPRYCLLVFGPEARTRIWLVQDGDTLYVDRNGNGDLTEAGENVAAQQGDYTDPAEGVFFFEAGEVPDGKLVHKNLRVQVRKLDHLADRSEGVKQYLARQPLARGYSLSIDVEMPGRKGHGIGGRVEQCVSLRDLDGFLAFAGRPQDAPVIHLGGPCRVLFFDRPRLTAGREQELTLGVGTPGLGAGTTAYFAYERLIPEGVCPAVEITYPPGPQGGPVVRERYELKERC
jgi:hypothetical protein